MASLQIGASRQHPGAIHLPLPLLQATISIKWFSGLGEIRIDWGPGYRVYLAKDGDTLIVLFGGGTKASQSKDIERARGMLADYKTRKRAQADVQRSKGKR